jgi:hypothetical protein
VENSPKFAERACDISSWQEGDITLLSTRSRKKYKKRKTAIEEYFTTDTAIDEISLRNQISEERLLQLVEQCLMQAEDGAPWGFRALFPGVTVVDYAARPVIEEAGEIAATPEIAEEDTQTLAEDVKGEDPGNSTTTTETEETPPLANEELFDSNEGEDTTKRTAIKPSLASAVRADETDTAGTPLPMSVENEGDETTEIAADVDETTVTLEPLTTQEAVEIESIVEVEEPTDTLEPLAMLEDAEVEAPAEIDEPTATLEPLAALEGEEIEAPAEVDEATVKLEPLTVKAQQALAASRQPEEAIASKEDVAVEAKKGDVVEETTLEERVPRLSNGQLAVAEAERIVVEEKGGVGTELAALNGHGEERALLPTRTTYSLTNYTLPEHISRNDAYSRHAALQRRMVRKRWLRDEQIHHKKRRTLQIISAAVLAAILLFILVPVGAGFAAYGAYNNISGIAHDGVNHLLKVKSLLPVSKSDPTAVLNVKNLQQAQIEFKAAESDFVQLQQLVNRTDVQAAITQFAPQYTNKLDMAQRLAQVALDVSRMGNELCSIALIGANIIHGSPLSSGSNKPIISVADVAAIEGSMVHALYYIDDIQEQMSQVSIKDIPVSDSQKKQLVSVLSLLPTARDYIVQAQGLVGLVAWLLGVGQQRRYLVQTMDSAELRPGGGFTGQYGILQIQDGRTSPFNLTDVTLLDYAENGTAIGRTAPPGYSWMNFGNWGVRDSNLSGDFPTTARMTMQLYQDEGGGPVDGDIAFTPSLIGHIIDVIGPIKVPGYNETITSKNLEERLHYYQQDFSAIAREKQISGNYSHSGRKAFTSTLGKILLDRLRHAQVKQLIEIAKGAIKDLQSRDLEIYFTNPAAEGWLIEHGYSGSIDTFAKQDGFMVVQANISISKASQFVHTTEQDAVTLDAQGGATHNLTITLDYQQKGPVYGFDTYADYIRVYAPKNAVLTGGDGFDTGKALCKPNPPRGKTSPTPGGTGTPVTFGCSRYNTSFPSNARYCPSGNYSLGMRGGLNIPWVIDSLGPPTAITSDLPGRAMWGGLTETPKNCTSYITLSWYVPHAVQKVNGQPSYTILVQKQSGYVPTIELSIDASAIKGVKSFTFTGNITADKAFTLTTVAKKK